MESTQYIKGLKDYYNEKYLRKRFNNLLIVLILCLLSGSWIYQVFSPVLSLLLLITVSLAIRVAIKRHFFLVVSMPLLAFILQTASRLGAAFPYSVDYQAVALFIFAIFLALAIILISRELIKNHAVTSDMVKGGICIYLLTGIFWSLLYRLVELYDPMAFSIRSNELHDLIYFSFITLTTVGYGDINPIHPLARSLSMLEAVTGQMLVAIFMASIVGLYNARRSQKATSGDLQSDENPTPQP